MFFRTPLSVCASRGFVSITCRNVVPFPHAVPRPTASLKQLQAAPPTILKLHAAYAKTKRVESGRRTVTRRVARRVARHVARHVARRVARL